MKTISTFLCCIIFTLNVSAQSIDKINSTIEFSVDYLGIGSVEGSFSNFNGMIYLDEEDIYNSSFDFSIKANSVATKSNRRTRFLKSKDFFNTDEFETLRFSSSEILFKNNSYIVAGDLTIKDIKKRIEIPFQVTENLDGVSLSGNMIVNRFDFDLGNKYKEWVIGKEVNIAINCVVNTPKMELA